MAKENSFMNMIDKGVKDTKKEGIMTAEQYKQGGDLNYVIEMMKNETSIPFYWCLTLRRSKPYIFYSYKYCICLKIGQMFVVIST